MAGHSRDATQERLTPVGKYIELYREHCGGYPLINNQEAEVINKLAEWQRSETSAPVGQNWTVADVIDLRVHAGLVYYHAKNGVETISQGTLAHTQNTDIKMSVQPNGYYKLTFCNPAPQGSVEIAGIDPVAAPEAPATAGSAPVSAIQGTPRTKDIYNHCAQTEETIFEDFGAMLKHAADLELELAEERAESERLRAMTLRVAESYEAAQRSAMVPLPEVQEVYDMVGHNIRTVESLLRPREQPWNVTDHCRQERYNVWMLVHSALKKIVHRIDNRAPSDRTGADHG